MDQTFHKPLAVILALLGLLLAACTSPQTSAGPSDTGPIPVRVATATLGDISIRSEYVASIEARDQVDLTPLVSGHIQQLDVDVGSAVQQGQVIAQLSSGTLEAERRQARANLVAAESRLASLESRLGSDRIIAQARLDAARARLEQLVDPSPLDLQAATGAVDRARAELETARTELRRLENPTASELATARAAVADAEGRLSRAHMAVNHSISARLAAVENPMPSQVRRPWEILLISRLHQQDRVALLRNLQDTYGLDLTASEVETARRAIEQNQVNMSALMSLIEAESLIPQEINQAMWEETAARSALEEAQSRLRHLEDPDPDTRALAQQRVAAAQGSLVSAQAELELLRDPTTAAVASAMQEVTEAEQALELAQEGPASHAAAEARAEVARAQAGVDLAAQRLEDTRIVAPFNGLVTRRLLSVGAQVSPQTPIVTITSVETVVSIPVDETVVHSLKPDQRAILTSPALTGQRVELVIHRISPAGDRRDHTFLVQFQPVAADPELRPGMSSQVTIETRREQRLLVPRQAVVHRQNGPAVFVVKDGRAQFHLVTLGVSTAGELEVTSGIQPGDQVAVSGVDRLRDGDPVAAETAS